MTRARKFWGRILCVFGSHDWKPTPLHVAGQQMWICGRADCTAHTKRQP